MKKLLLKHSHHNSLNQQGSLPSQKGSLSPKRTPQKFQEPPSTFPQEYQGTWNAETKDEDEIPTTHDYERGTSWNNSIDSCPELNAPELRNIPPPNYIPKFVSFLAGCI
ncbi:hypothetical protein O181_081788 [Austropuccinia psidii MF-1]|uniref:Uncharacterized protein n=1 Tax=Austropuccinia psidii MF-1 TaxID=1389203 RepID=A0A9Q3FL95_9BASI|nr:hypothetical protein [Austropuccinia psidii MF-1]